MTPTGLLDVDDEAVVKKHVALPSPLYASDHVHLLVEMAWRVD